MAAKLQFESDTKETHTAGRKIKGLLFDLGETLINFGPLNTPELFRESAGRSYQFLKDHNQPIKSYRHHFWYNIIGLRSRIWWSDFTGNDFDALKVLKRKGIKRGYNLTGQQWQEYHFCWYEPLMSKACSEPDIADTLSRLHESGLKLGIISNSFVHSSALDKHLESIGILRFFDTRLYSCNFSFRKPDKRIFLSAAQQIGLDNSEIAYIGDRIEKDINGSRNAGMMPILKNAFTNDNKRCPEGIIRIDKISELPEIIKKINSN